MNCFKERCLALRKQDYSLNEIAEITGRPKTSIYQHIRNVPLSENKRHRISKAQGNRIRVFALQRKA